MTDIVRDAVRAGCETFYPKTCLYPDCTCPNRRGDDRHGLETAARHAAESMREKAAQNVDCGCECRPMVLMALTNSVRAASNCCTSSNVCAAVEAAQIRAIPTGDTP